MIIWLASPVMGFTVNMTPDTLASTIFCTATAISASMPARASESR